MQVTGIVVVIVAGWTGSGPLLACWGMGATAAVGLFYLRTGINPLRGNPARWLRDTRHLLGWYTATGLLAQTTTLLIGTLVQGLLTRTAYSGFRVVQMLVLQPAQSLAMALNGLLVPRASQLAGRGDLAGLRRQTRGVLAITAGIGLAIVAVAAVAAGPVLRTYKHGDYAGVIPIAVPIALQTLTYLMQVAFTVAIRGMQRGRQIFAQYLVFSTTSLTGLVVGAWQWHLLGAAWGRALWSRPRTGRPGLALPGVHPSAPRGADQSLRRPNASSSRSTGVRWITWVKLTFSLAAVSPASTASSAARPSGPVRAASATPSSAPSAFAPLSPSITRSSRSSGSSAGGGADGAGGDAAVRATGQRRAAPQQQAGLQRPAGPQVEQVEQVRGAGDDTGAEQHVEPRGPPAAGAGAGGRRRAARPRQAGGAHPDDLDQAGGDPPLPQRGEVPGEALGGLLLRPGADHVVVEPDRPAPSPATAAAAAGAGSGPRRPLRRSPRPRGRARRPRLTAPAAEVGPLERGPRRERCAPPAARSARRAPRLPRR